MLYLQAQHGLTSICGHWAHLGLRIVPQMSYTGRARRIVPRCRGPSSTTRAPFDWIMERLAGVEAVVNPR
jgi:hypothetical protein